MQPSFQSPTLEIILNFLLELSNSILPFASGIIIFYLTYGKEKKLKRSEVLQKRLDTFYVPYYQFYCRKLLNINALYSFSTEQICELFELLSKNIYNMGTLSQALYSDFYLAYCDLFEARNGKPHYFISTCSTDFEMRFTALSNQLFEEYTDICHSLKLPSPAKELCKRPDFSLPDT